MEIVGLVAAAGRGHRAGGAIPKQYADLGGRAVLYHAASALARHPRIAAVRVVIHPDDRALYDRATRGLDLLDPVPGGATRQDSVRLGLESLEPLAPARVLIHDGARPFLDAAVTTRICAALDEVPAALAAVPLTDTLKRAEDDRVAATLPRENLWRAQTPQGFHFAALLAAHGALAGADRTDDAALAEQAGLPVRLVAGDPRNVKITTAEDLALARRMLASSMETRVGQGFDVHRLGPGDHVMLCGLRLAHERGLIGHSDADVALHALTDAVLGALGAGDIGEHFPPNDARWRGAPSHLFLRHAAELVRAAGGMILHADVTVICERPKLAPHKPAMRARLAEILALTPDRVSVKATTSEGLGFTGREEGIAAQAVATVALPARDVAPDIALGEPPR